MFTDCLHNDSIVPLKQHKTASFLKHGQSWFEFWVWWASSF